MPAVVLVPFVAIFGSGFDQGIATALFGGANVALLWLLLRRAGVAPSSAGWLTAAFAIGSVHWWVAGTGTVWLHAQVVAVFFALLALNLAIGRRWPFVAGVLLGCAAASRGTFPSHVSSNDTASTPLGRPGMRNLNCWR